MTYLSLIQHQVSALDIITKHQQGNDISSDELLDLSNNLQAILDTNARDFNSQTLVSWASLYKSCLLQGIFTRPRTTGIDYQQESVLITAQLLYKREGTLLADTEYLKKLLMFLINDLDKNNEAHSQYLNWATTIFEIVNCSTNEITTIDKAEVDQHLNVLHSINDVFEGKPFYSLDTKFQLDFLNSYKWIMTNIQCQFIRKQAQLLFHQTLQNL